MHAQMGLGAWNCHHCLFTSARFVWCGVLLEVLLYCTPSTDKRLLNPFKTRVAHSSLGDDAVHDCVRKLIDLLEVFVPEVRRRDLVSSCRCERLG